jgi:uncharacterized membrane protein
MFDKQKHNFVSRHIRARPRLFVSILLGVVAAMTLPNDWELVTRLLIAWNFATLVYICSVGLMMARATADQIRRYAALHDEGQYIILVLAVVAAIACLGAIIVQLGLVKSTSGVLKAGHLSLAFLTLVTAWTFIHLVFAQHYAHEYYDEYRTKKDSELALRGGLEFIGADQPPHYSDFVYYAFTIGCSTATSDVNLTSRPMRHITLIHSILSFFFNLALLGLTINIAAGLI